MIPVCQPFLNGNELKYVNEAVRTGWISSSGKYVKAFEEAFAEYCGVKYAVAVCNCTVALHLALVCLDIEKGDEVIIPDFTMIASAFSVCYTGAKPVFVDADEKTWNIDVSKIEEKITPKTKAIMPVHIFGNPCDMDAIQQIASKHNLFIIEDAAEAHGAEYQTKRTEDRGQRTEVGGQMSDSKRTEKKDSSKQEGRSAKSLSSVSTSSQSIWRKCGSFGDIAAFSFFANKNITTGEGGMVVTDSERLYKKALYHKNLCFDPDAPRNYIHNDIGFNYRMSNIHAAIGLAQTEKADEYKEMRIRNGKIYRKYLRDIKGIILQEDQAGAENVFWMNGILLEPEKYGRTRDELVNLLKENGIDTRHFFVGMHRQPSLQKFGCDGTGDYPITDNLAQNGFYLPSASNLKEDEIKHICDEIRGQ
jgi:perosamine synthetase